MNHAMTTTMMTTTMMGPASFDEFCPTRLDRLLVLVALVLVASDQASVEPTWAHVVPRWTRVVTNRIRLDACRFDRDRSVLIPG